MRAFKFSLKPVQQLREREEQTAMEAYARALLERTKAMDRLRAAEQALAEEQSEWQQRAGKGCAAGLLARRASGCQILARQRDALLRALGESERIVHARMQEMLLARQKLEALNRLETRGRRDHAQNAARSHQNFLDNLAQRRPDSSLVFRATGNCVT